MIELYVIDCIVKISAFNVLFCCGFGIYWKCFSCQFINILMMTIPSPLCMTKSLPECVSRGQCVNTLQNIQTIPISIISARDKQSHNVMDHWTLTSMFVTVSQLISRQWDPVIVGMMQENVWKIGLLQSNVNHCSSLTFLSLHPVGALKQWWIYLSS